MLSWEQFEDWYARHCDGCWEHGEGIRIDSLDDPGWKVKIALRGTALESNEFPEVKQLEPGDEWLHCRVRDGCFEGYGGPRMLGPILSTFLTWADGSERIAA